MVKRLTVRVGKNVLKMTKTKTTNKQTGRSTNRRCSQFAWAPSATAALENRIRRADGCAREKNRSMYYFIVIDFQTDNTRADDVGTDGCGQKEKNTTPS